MPINPNISLAVKGIELQDPLAQYGKVMAIQDAQSKNQLAQMQMQEYERTRGEEQEIRNRLAGGRPIDDPDIVNLLYGSKTGREILKARTETQKAATEEAARRAKLMTDTESMYRNIVNHVVDKSSAISFLTKMVNDPAMKGSPITRIPFEQQIANIPDDPVKLNDWSKQFALGATKWATENKLQLSTTDLGGKVELHTFEPLTGRLKTIGTQPKTMAPGEAVRIKNEGLRIGLEGRRVAVLEENIRRDADPAFQQRMSGAKAFGEAIAKGDVAAMQALPKVISRAEEGVRLIDELIGKRDSKTGQLIKGEKTHAGFQDAVGATWLPGARFVPGTDAAGFMSRFDQIKGASFLEAFETLKGGGSITEKEGQKGTDAINRMSTSTSEKEFIRAAMDLQDVIRKGVSNAQTRASRAGGGGAPAAGGVDTSNPLLK